MTDDLVKRLRSKIVSKRWENEAADRIEADARRIEELEERLEIRRAWTWDGNPQHEMERYEIPKAERAKFPDGIECRDETIRLQDIRIAALEAENARLRNGDRSLPYDREQLGRFVREAWVRWAKQQPNPKPSWLVDYDELAEADKEADRQIGEAVARWVIIGDSARAALAKQE